MSKKRGSYTSDSDELRNKKKDLLKDRNIDNIPRADSFNVNIDKHYLDGKKSSLDEIANLDIVVFDAKITRSKFIDNSTGDNKKMLILQFGLVEEDLETTYVIFTGASNLIEFIKQFTETGHEFPFRTSISKHGKSYMFD